MNIIEVLAKEFGLKQSQVEQTVNLIDEGNTIPFIARYRKEATGGLSDVVLRDLDERLTYLRNLEERKEEVIRLIEEQDKLTDELAEEIRKAEVLQRVEDLYKPYKKKKATRASEGQRKRSGAAGGDPLERRRKSAGSPLKMLAKGFCRCGQRRGVGGGSCAGSLRYYRRSVISDDPELTAAVGERAYGSRPAMITHRGSGSARKRLCTTCTTSHSEGIEQDPEPPECWPSTEARRRRSSR